MLDFKAILHLSRSIWWQMGCRCGGVQKAGHAERLGFFFFLKMAMRHWGGF